MRTIAPSLGLGDGWRYGWREVQMMSVMVRQNATWLARKLLSISEEPSADISGDVPHQGL